MVELPAPDSRFGVQAPNSPARKQGIRAGPLALRQGSFLMGPKGMYALPLSVKLRFTARRPLWLLRSRSRSATAASLPYTTLPSRKEVSALICSRTARPRGQAAAERKKGRQSLLLVIRGSLGGICRWRKGKVMSGSGDGARQEPSHRA